MCRIRSDISSYGPGNVTLHSPVELMHSFVHLYAHYLFVRSSNHALNNISYITHPSVMMEFHELDFLLT